MNFSKKIFIYHYKNIILLEFKNINRGVLKLLRPLLFL